MFTKSLDTYENMSPRDQAFIQQVQSTKIFLKQIKDLNENLMRNKEDIIQMIAHLNNHMFT